MVISTNAATTSPARTNLRRTFSFEFTRFIPSLF
jgi:hypothetical protein